MAMNVQQMHSLQMYKNTQNESQTQRTAMNEQIRASALSLSQHNNEKSNSVITDLFSGGKATTSMGLQISFQAAVDAINQKLKEDLGLSATDDDPINQDKLNAQGMEYWNPENTSQRLIQGAMNFLPAFQNAHPELEGQALNDKFMEVVGGGLTQGFEEARSFLDDLGAMNEEIGNNIDSTYSLMQSGLQLRLADALGLDYEQVNATTAEMSVKIDDNNS